MMMFLEIMEVIRRRRWRWRRRGGGGGGEVEVVEEEEEDENVATDIDKLSRGHAPCFSSCIPIH